MSNVERRISNVEGKIKVNGNRCNLISNAEYPISNVEGGNFE